MAYVHMQMLNTVTFIRPALTEQEKMTARLANDGKWYTLADFQQWYPNNWEPRYADAPAMFERRRAVNSTQYMDAQWWYDNFGRDIGGGDRWNRYGKPGWDDAIPERRMADDGKWYTVEKFLEFYLDNRFNDRWHAAPNDLELRLGGDGQLHDAAWFFQQDTMLNNHWNINCKGSWSSAPQAAQPQVIGVAGGGVAVVNTLPSTAPAVVMQGSSGGGWNSGGGNNWNGGGGWNSGGARW